MQRSTVLALAVVAPILAWSSPAAAQSTKGIAGTYAGVSFTSTDASGNTTQIFGADPRAMMVLTADGHYSIIVMRASLPKFASNSRIKGTPDEYKGVVDGSIAHFGRYTVDKRDSTITFHVDASTFPNWDGQPQKRPFTIKGDELTYKVPAPSTGGGSSQVTWKRMKPVL